MRRAWVCLTLVSWILVGCEPAEPGAGNPASPPSPGLTVADIEIVEGQTVFVPAYSHVNYYIEGKTYLLAATLSIRNTDPMHSITIESVDYFDSNGALVQRFLEQPMSMPPMGSTEFFVEQADQRGGSGANFIVNWIAAQPVYEPVIEAVMVGTSGTLGIAFHSEGRVYGERTSRERYAP